jgi:hypothetical protein
MDLFRVSSDKNGFSLDNRLVLPITMQNFPSHYSKLERELLTDAHQAITECDLWDWMKTYTPDKGFVFSSHPNLDRINAAMKYTGHSGTSYGWTMRTMENIAKLGWDKALNPPCPCRRERGLTSGWCGVAGGGVPGCEH